MKPKNRGNAGNNFSKNTVFICKNFLFYAVIITLFWILIYLSIITYQNSKVKKILNEEKILIDDLQNKIYDTKISILKEISKEEFDKNVEAFDLSDGLTDEAKNYIRELNLTNPGENGVPVIIPQSASLDIQKKVNESNDMYGFNQFVSTLVSLNRVLPDFRPQECKDKVYRTELLPEVSIIIPFYNDDWTLLMRTIHSIIRQTPLHLIQEIILVDDYSTHEHLKEKLENYTATLPVIVRIIRSHTRLGIVGIRVLGARNARAPVVLYIDSHVEFNTGWIEPILDRFIDNMDLLVFGNVSSLNPRDMSVSFNNEADKIYTFNWGMHEMWVDKKWFEGNKTTKIYDPRVAPIGIAGVLAIGRKFYERIGYLDLEFDIWGGEDYELTLRSWLCGGRAEYIPCSISVHMFRNHKYSHQSKGKGGYRWNMDRIAELWMDDYKEYYYSDVENHTRIFGDLTERLELKNKLNCKPFQWYIDNVYPSLLDIKVKLSNVTEN